MNGLETVALDAMTRPWVRALSIVLASLVVATVADLVLRRVVTRLTRRTATDLDDRLLRQLRRPVFFSFVILGLYAAAGSLGVEPRLYLLISSVIQTLLVLIWTVAGLRVTSTVLEALSRLADRTLWLDTRTLPLFDNLFRLVLIAGAAYGLLAAWDLNPAPWLASAGIVGIAVGFAAKDSLANLFGGLFVIVDAPYKLGDFINLSSGERGQVIKIGLRSTRLLTRDDVEITLPNAQIANSTIVNESGGPWEKTRVSITVGVAYGSDVDRVREILQRAATSVENVVRDPEPRIRFTELGDSALIFRVLCWVDEPVLRGRCIDALNTAVYKMLVAENITIPFPQRDVHVISRDGPS